LETVKKVTAAEDSRSAKNVAKVVGATSSEGFSSLLWFCAVE